MDVLDEVRGGIVTRFKILEQPQEHRQGLAALEHHQYLSGHDTCGTKHYTTLCREQGENEMNTIASLAFVFPLTPGKTEEWRHWGEEILGSRHFFLPTSPLSLL